MRHFPKFTSVCWLLLLSNCWNNFTLIYIQHGKFENWGLKRKKKILKWKSFEEFGNWTLMGNRTFDWKFFNMKTLSAKQILKKLSLIFYFQQNRQKVWNLQKFKILLIKLNFYNSFHAHPFKKCHLYFNSQNIPLAPKIAKLIPHSNNLTERQWMKNFLIWGLNLVRKIQSESTLWCIV